MTLRTVRIGGVPDAFQYDDADYPNALETDQPMKAGPPIDPSDVLRLEDNGGKTGDVSGPAGATDSNLAEFDTVTGKLLKDGGLSHADVSDAVSKKHTHADVTQNITVVTNVVGPVTATLHFTNGLLTSVT